jgi:hypothetical protein
MIYLSLCNLPMCDTYDVNMASITNHLPYLQPLDPLSRQALAKTVKRIFSVTAKLNHGRL